jgi:pSer/pThr/pTyr-binding forkhead associated (FHA) protein
VRVVDAAKGPPKAAPGEGRVCSRCRGIAEPSAQFCKFCGASLADAEGRSRSQTPPPPSRPEPRAPQNGGSTIVEDAPAGASVVPTPAPAVVARPIAQIALQSRPVPVPSKSVAPAAPGPAALAAAVARVSSAPPPPLAQAPARASMSAAAPQRGRLVVIAKSGADGPSYPFGDLLDIGRTEGNVIVAEDPYLSPRHVRIVWAGGKLALRDLGSTNGVYIRLAPARDVNGRRDAGEVSMPLAHHDLILVGQQVLRFEVLKEGEGGFGPAQEHGTLLFGSPAAPRYARLCQRTVEGIARDVYYIRKAETVLGRESGDVVFTEDPFLSRRHAAIRLVSANGALVAGSPPRTPTEPRFLLTDLGSSNGTFLRIRGDVELAPGDHFRVGQQLFRVDFEGARGAGE